MGSGQSLEVRPLSEEELHKLWSFYDSDGSGQIDRAELYKLLNKIADRDGIKTPLPTECANMVFKKLDRDQDGTVSWIEFLQLFNGYWQHRQDQYETMHQIVEAASSRAPSESEHEVDGTDDRTDQYNLLREAEKEKEREREREVQKQREKEWERERERAQRERDRMTGSRPASVSASRPSLRESGRGVSAAATGDFRGGEDMRSDARARERQREKEIAAEKERLRRRLENLEAEDAESGSKWRTPPSAEQSRWRGGSPGYDSSQPPEGYHGEHREEVPSRLYAGDRDLFRCPHCHLSIDQSIIANFVKQTATGGPTGNAGRASADQSMPLYGPNFYQGMWSYGRTYGPVPPSFFSSPYNTHTWSMR